MGDDEKKKEIDEAMRNHGEIMIKHDDGCQCDMCSDVVTEEPEEIVEPRRLRLSGSSRTIPNIIPRPEIIEALNSAQGEELLNMIKANINEYPTDIYLALSGGPLQRSWVSKESIKTITSDHKLRKDFTECLTNAKLAYEYEIGQATMYDIDYATTVAYLRMKELYTALYKDYIKLVERIATIEQHVGMVQEEIATTEGEEGAAEVRNEP